MTSAPAGRRVSALSAPDAPREDAIRTIRILAGDLTGFSKQLVRGFGMYRRALARGLGLRAGCERYESPSRLAGLLARGGADPAIVMPRFSERADDLCAVLAAAKAARPERPLVLLDGHDQTSSPHFAVLPHVDRYVKSKMLRDAADYQNDYRGGYVFADFYARTYGFDLAGWHFGSIPDPALAQRIVPGWNFAVTPRCRVLARANRIRPRPLAERRYDLSLRLSLAPDHGDRDWYHDYRARCRAATEPLRARFRATPPERLGPWRFLRELRQSRIVFSPFGWGEVCWRDYESVASGALLVKPSVEHLVTSPDVFVDGETYVKTRWDLADLEEKIAHYLAHPHEAQRIADNASRVLADYFERGGFVEDVRRTLDPVLPAGHRRAP